MVSLIRSKTYPTDPKDVWGKETTIGLAEHAARLGSLMVFDKRGSILFWDDYEYPTPRYDLYQILGGTVNRSTNYAYSRSFSLKCTPTGGAGSQAGPKYYLTDFHEDETLSISTSITSPDGSGWYFYSRVMYYDGTNVSTANIRYTADGSLAYYNDSGGWTSLTSIPRYDSAYNWGSFNIVVNLNTKKYVSCSVFRTETDLSAYNMYSTASATNPHIEVTLYFEDIVGTSIVGYIDSVVIAESV